MSISEQGAFINVYKQSKIFLQAYSRDSTGMPLSGHGIFRKHALIDSDTAIGASVRLCIHDRQPGHYRPHMYKERDAYLKMRKAYIEDRGIASDEDFNKNTHSFNIGLWNDRIEYIIFSDDPDGRPYITLPLTANDEELGRALRQTYQHILALAPTNSQHP